MNTLLMINIGWVVGVSLLLAIELTIIIAAFLQMFPLPVASFVEKLFPVHRYDVRPEREMLYYHIALFGTMALSFAGAYLFRYRLTTRHVTSRFKYFVITTAVGLCVVLAIIFKHIVTPALKWPPWALPTALILLALVQIFFKEVTRYYRWYTARAGGLVCRVPWGLVFMGFIGICLWPSDMQAVLARTYVFDNFYHFDGVIMAPAWAHLKGMVLNKDVISQYGVLAPMLIQKGARALGGFDYAHVIAVHIIVTGLYCGALYMFLSRWLKARWAAVCGVLLFIKWNLFHWGVSPLVWMLPQVVPIRYVFDMPVLFLLLWHVQTGRSSALWAAAVLTGIAIAYMLDTGLYLALSLGAYVVCVHTDRGEWKKLVRVLPAIIGITVLTAMGVLYIASSGASFTADYWARFTEHARLFMAGWGALPINHGMREHNYFAFWMGVFIPVFYVCTLVLCLLPMLDRRAGPRRIIAAVLCVYGLALYHYFMGRSAVSSYYVVCMPFAALLCYWGTSAVQRLNIQTAAWVRAGAVAWAVGALFTNTLFSYYPNVFRLAGYDFSVEKKLYAAGLNIDQDVALMRRLTNPADKVALVSSYEVEILRRADRKPFFYYFPLITSRPFEEPLLGGTYLHTQERMAQTFEHIDGEKPEYIFIEGKLLNLVNAPQAYAYFKSLAILVDRIKKDYTPVEQGKYLIALKRIPGR